MERRSLLALAGTTLLTGCSGTFPFGSTPTPSPDPTATARPFRRAADPGYTPTDDPFADHRQSGGLELGRGEYVAFSFDSDSPIQLQFDFAVESGGPVDVMTMSDDSFDGYAAGNGGGMYPAASVEANRTGTVEARLPAGAHVLVFDNTYQGATKPSGTVRVRYGISIGEPSTPTPKPTATPFPFGEARSPGFSPDDNPFSEYQRSGGLALPRGRYKAFILQNESGFTLSYGFEVRSGDAIDVLLMGGDAFDTFAAERRGAQYYANASAGSSSGGQTQVRLPAGTHVLVFDNTYLGPARPSGTARVVYGFGFGDQP